MSKYIYENPNWPNFYWDKKQIASILTEVKFAHARLLGKISSLGNDLQQESSRLILENEIIKSNEIEDEIFESKQVRSSICRKFGIATENNIENKNNDGFVNLIFDATQNYHKAITTERLLNWHISLFPTGRNGIYKITVGHWRKLENEPMQVI
jgi:Fic family protein